MKLLFENQGWFLQPASADTKEFVDKIAKGSFIEFEYKDEPKGSRSMLNTWWVWMTETADFMAGNGVTMPLMITAEGKYHGTRPFNKDDAHHLFSSQYLGVDDMGKRKSWSMDKSGKTIQASKGDRLHCMDCHLAWAIEKGINLTIPREGEYQKLKLAEVA